MARVVLVTGGSRSGKSRYALERAAGLGGTRTYVATCPPAVDAEMDGRIERHRREREGCGWLTVEAALDPAGPLADCAGEVVVVDCLTLWIGNLLHEDTRIDEDEIERRSLALFEAASGREGTVIFVTNEVGSGIVPDNPLARRFRDLAGRCNQTIAAGADEVVLLVSGISVEVKP